MYRRQDGFTLIELLVGLALMALVMAALGGMLSAFLGHGVQSVAQIERQQEARWVLDMIVQDIQYATAYCSGTASSSVIEVEKKVTQDTQQYYVRVRYYLEDAGTGNGNQVLKRRVWIPANAVMYTDDSQVSSIDHGYVGEADFVVMPSVINKDDGTQRVTQVSLVYRIRSDQTDTSPQTAQITVYFPNWEKLTPPKLL